VTNEIKTIFIKGAATCV